jgi:hypothetical protein
MREAVGAMMLATAEVAERRHEGLRGSMAVL